MATEPRVPQSGSGPAQILAELLIGGGSVLLLVGLVSGTGDVSPKPMPSPHSSRCDPVVWHDGTDPGGWRMLLDDGYAPRSATEHAPIYPPGCEASP